MEDKGIATVWLQLGLPGQKGILLMCGYRQWRLPGQLDGGSASGTVPAQRERWSKLLSQWEKALGENREVICAMDANIDALTWFNQDIAATGSNEKLKPLIEDLFEKIFAGPKRGRPTPGFSIFIRSYVRPFVRSYVRPFVRSSVRPFVRSYVLLSLR